MSVNVDSSAAGIIDIIEDKCFDWGQMGPPGGLEGIIAVAKEVRRRINEEWDFIEGLERDLENERAAGHYP